MEGEDEREEKENPNNRKKDSLALNSFGMENSIQSFQKMGSGMSYDLRPPSSLFPVII